MFNIRLTDQEKKTLKEISSKFGYNVTDYVKRKLFEENEDLAANTERYITPHCNKKDLISVSTNLKTFYLVREVLKNLKNNAELLLAAEQRSLDYARSER